MKKSTIILSLLSGLEFCIIIVLCILLTGSSSRKEDPVGRTKTKIKADITDFSGGGKYYLYVSGDVPENATKAERAWYEKHVYRFQVDSTVYYMTKEEFQIFLKAVSDLLEKTDVYLVKEPFVYDENGKKHTLEYDWTFNSSDRAYYCDIVDEKFFCGKLNELIYECRMQTKFDETAYLIDFQDKAMKCKTSIDKHFDNMSSIKVTDKAVITEIDAIIKELDDLSDQIFPSTLEYLKSDLDTAVTFLKTLKSGLENTTDETSAEMYIENYIPNAKIILERTFKAIGN